MRIDLLVLFTRPFWLDEWHTMLVANRESLGQLIADLYRGSDFAPPLIHLITWLLSRIAGPLGPGAARAVSFLCVLGAAAFVFQALRRRFGVPGSLTGALAVLSHPIVLSNAFELRFYCLWILFAAAFAWAVGLDGDKAVSRRRDAAIAASAVLLVLSHWLAVLSLGLMSLGAMAAHWRADRRLRPAITRLLPAAAGLVALAVALPLMFGQRASIVEKSWMPDPGFEHLVAMLRMFWAPDMLLDSANLVVIAVLVILVAMLRPRAKERLAGRARAAALDPSLIAMLSLAAIPILLFIVSLRQPAMLPRYAIAAILAWAPLVALAVEILSRVSQGLFIAAFTIFLWLSTLRVAIQNRNFTIAISGARETRSYACGLAMPVVFHTRHTMYPAMEGGAIGNCDARYVALSDGTLDRMYPGNDSRKRFFRIENEFSVLHQKLYGFPRVTTDAQLDSLPSFVLVGWEEGLPQGYRNFERFAAVAFPNHRVTRVTPALTRFDRE